MKGYLQFITLIEFSTGMIAISDGSKLLLHISTGSEGFRFLDISLILIGVALLLLSCVNFRKPDIAVAKFTRCSVPLFAALASLGVFALAVSAKGGGKSIPGRSYKEYHVESYSKWMQNKITHNWDNNYQKAIIKNKEYVCNDKMLFYFQLETDPAFKSSCCEPPRDCFYNNSTPPITKTQVENGSYTNDDCYRWNTDPNTLCFNCQSCKAGFLEDVASHWFTIGFEWIFIGGIELLVGIWFCFMAIIFGDPSSQGYRQLV